MPYDSTLHKTSCQESVVCQHTLSKLEAPWRATSETIKRCFIHVQTGEQLYHNAFATNHELTRQTVAPIVRAGRTRWKSENENNNILKTKGYHLEHNFGHGQQYLASFLLTLNLLAFLFHTILELLDANYRLLRQELATRQTFFNDIRALTPYFYFNSWQHLLEFMIQQLELNPDTS